MWISNDDIFNKLKKKILKKKVKSHRVDGLISFSNTTNANNYVIKLYKIINNIFLSYYLFFKLLKNYFYI